MIPVIYGQLLIAVVWGYLLRVAFNLINDGDFEVCSIISIGLVILGWFGYCLPGIFS